MNCFICSLTIYVIVVLITNGEKTRLVDSSGMSEFIRSYKVLTTLGIGWAAFGLSLIFNILYYALHPSQVTPITLICLQSSLISPPGLPAGHQGEACGVCVWLSDQSGDQRIERIEISNFTNFHQVKLNCSAVLEHSFS